MLLYKPPGLSCIYLVTGLAGGHITWVWAKESPVARIGKHVPEDSVGDGGYRDTE